MKKKIVSALLTAAVTLSLLAGCGGAQNGGNDAGAAAEVQATAESAGSEAASEEAAPEEAADENEEAPAEEASGTDSAKDITVNVGDQAAFFLVKVAEKKGFFEEEFAKDGITIHSEIFAKMGPAIIEAMAAGDVDLSIVGVFPVVNAK